MFSAGEHAPRVTQVCMSHRGCWQNESAEPLIAQITSPDGTLPLHWRLNQSASSSNAREVIFIYDSDQPHLRLIWQWRVRGNTTAGPIEHSIRIENLTNQDISIPVQQSAQFSWTMPAGMPLQQLWVEKGAGRPSADGTHLLNISKSYTWQGKSSTYAHPAAGEQREMIPYVLVQRSSAGRSGLYLGVEFSGPMQIRLDRKRDRLNLRAGLTPETAQLRLAAGEAFETPTVFLGTFLGGPDGAANLLRPWVRSVLNNPVTVRDTQYPLVVNNSWGSGMAIDASQARAMIRDSAELGFEMFHLDAGWFRGVGDWQPDPKKFPDGLAPIAEYAHAAGLRFGIWMNWSQAGFDNRPGSLYLRDPKISDWLTTDAPLSWQPSEAFRGITMDIGEPEVHYWVDTELESVVRDFHIDMLEHDGYVVPQGCDRSDHRHAPADATTAQYQDGGIVWVKGANSTDVSYRATRSYYEIYSKLRREHPKLLLEICNDGGRMVDFGSAAHGDYFSISDAYDPLSNRRAFYDASYVLPPAMLETYVEKWPAPRPQNFLYVLRSGMMGWFTLMLDTTALTPEQHAVAKSALALYKTKLRPFIRNADLYHVTARADGIHWDGMEYVDAATQKGVLYAFHGTSPVSGSHDFVLRGLKSKQKYRLTFEDKSSADQVVSGASLMKLGLHVVLPLPESSELVFFEPLT